MITVTVELVPGGIGKPRRIAGMMIGNIADLANISSYIVVVDEDGNERLGIPAMNKQCTITEHARRQSVWALIAKCAAAAAPINQADRELG